jgi:hypothetical protein
MDMRVLAAGVVMVVDARTRHDARTDQQREHGGRAAIDPRATTAHRRPSP